jgi:DNA (cytosine-5)-methyltransferase 1
MGIRVLDLFCGCGGMSWGLYKASSNFEIVAGIDIDKIALKTFRRNHPNALISNDDLSEIEPLAWLDQHKINPIEIDCIIGGPPCQGFSKNVPRSQRFLEDPRNLLVQRYLEFVRIIKPPIIIMENVAEIVNAFDGELTTEILILLRSWGYSADVVIIDTADFGVPQHRRRAFFMGSLYGEVQFPEVTHSAPGEILPLFEAEQKFHINVWDAISDLPSLQHSEGENIASYTMPPQTAYQRKMRTNTIHLYNHVAKKLSSIQYERLSSLQPGEGARQLPEHLRPKSHYSGAYGRLTKDMVARTLTRWLFHAGSGRYGHPVDIRTITIREAARLQSFSDDFVFEGSFTQASSQIGNSVPPLIMEAFAPIIESHLQEKSGQIIYER